MASRSTFTSRNTRADTKKYSRIVRIFLYLMLGLSFVNGLARADYTSSVCVIGLIALWFEKKDAALLFFYALCFTALCDLAWIFIHGNYLHDYGAIPAGTPATMTNLLRLHKWSLGVSIVQFMTKICSLFYVYMFWFLLGHDDEDLPLEDKHLNTYNAYADEMTTGDGMGEATVNSIHSRS